MSDTNNQDDQVDIPEGAPENFSDQRAKKGISPGLKLGILVGGVFSILGASFFLASSGPEPESVMRSAPSLDATPGGALQAENPLYQDLLEQANDQRARDALDRGETFIPIPEGQLEPVTRFDTADAGAAADRPEVETQPEPVVLPDPPAPRLIEQRAIPAPAGVNRQTAASNTQQQQNPYVQGMIQQMGAIAGRQNQMSNMLASDILSQESEVVAENVGGNPDTSGFTEDTAPVISAGTILYGETLTSSSSDLPGPVLVQVTNGPFKGGRLVGKFTTAEAVDRMIVEFTSMTLPDGTSVAVSAFAVDGMSAQTAVASDVNRRYISRYAPILAAAFITGYAGSAAQPEQQVVELGAGNTVVSGVTTSEQNLYAGLAAAGGAVGADLLRTAPKGPEVILRSGWPIGIMFVEPVIQ
jgi:hypothetical protein